MKVAPVQRTLGASGGLAGVLCLVAVALGRTVVRRVASTMDALAEAGRALAKLRPIVSPGSMLVLKVERL